MCIAGHLGLSSLLLSIGDHLDLVSFPVPAVVPRLSNPGLSFWPFLQSYHQAQVLSEPVQ